MESNVFEAHGAANGNKHSKPMACKCKHIFKAHGDAYGKHIQSPWDCTWKTNSKPMVLNRKNKFKAHAPPHGAPHFALEGSEMVVVAELVVPSGGQGCQGHPGRVENKLVLLWG